MRGCATASALSDRRTPGASSASTPPSCTASTSTRSRPSSTGSARRPRRSTGRPRERRPDDHRLHRPGRRHHRWRGGHRAGAGPRLRPRRRGPRALRHREGCPERHGRGVTGRDRRRDQRRGRRRVRRHLGRGAGRRGLPPAWTHPRAGEQRRRRAARGEGVGDHAERLAVDVRGQRPRRRQRYPRLRAADDRLRRARPRREHLLRRRCGRADAGRVGVRGEQGGGVDPHRVPGCAARAGGPPDRRLAVPARGQGATRHRPVDLRSQPARAARQGTAPRDRADDGRGPRRTRREGRPRGADPAAGRTRRRRPRRHSGGRVRPDARPGRRRGDAARTRRALRRRRQPHPGREPRPGGLTGPGAGRPGDPGDRLRRPVRQGYPDRTGPEGGARIGLARSAALEGAPWTARTRWPVAAWPPPPGRAVRRDRAAGRALPPFVGRSWTRR
ncbi:exported hypothetical protein [Frankia sp. AgKG'84/4]